MDRIFITALTAEAVIGIYDWERNVKQRLEIDLEMSLDLRAAGGSDTGLRGVRSLRSAEGAMHNGHSSKIRG